MKFLPLFTGFQSLNTNVLLHSILCFSFAGWSQGVYPNLFGNFLDFKNAYNASSNYTVSKAEFTSKHQSIAENLNKSAFQAYLSTGKDRILQNAILYLDREKSGPYLGIFSGSIGYQMSIRIKDSLYLSSAVGFGVYNYSARLPTLTNDIVVPSGYWGVSLISKSYTVGGSIQNMLNSSKDGIWLRRYFTGNLEKTNALTHEFSFRTGVLSRFFDDYQNDYRLYAGIEWYDKLRFGVITSAYKGLSVYAEPIFEWMGQKLSVSLAYNSQYGKNARFIHNSYEFGLRCTLY